MALSEKVVIPKISATSIYNKLGYKTQQIRNVHGELIGHEFLLSLDKLTHLEIEYFFKRLIIDTYSTKVMVRTIYENIKNLKFINDYIFINMERSHLCDNHLISEIIKLNFILKKHKSNLVVEITERDHCGSCVRIIEGIKYLSASGIMLAIDDYDIYKDDLSNFLFSKDVKDLFDIVKINIPEQYLLPTFNKFISKCDKRIIVEMVETREQLEQIENRNDIWGIQGYIYDKGVKL